MTLNDLQIYHEQLLHKKEDFIVDLFTKDIWGDNGIDCATIHIHANDMGWLLHFIRTESGIPYILADYTVNVIDEYEKVLSHEQLFDYLNLHNLIKDFLLYVKQ